MVSLRLHRDAECFLEFPGGVETSVATADDQIFWAPGGWSLVTAAITAAGVFDFKVSVVMRVTL
jgi:hypothetical protein